MKRAGRASHVARATYGTRASRGASVTRGALAASGVCVALNFDVMEVEIPRAGGMSFQIGKGLNFLFCLHRIAYRT